LTTGLNAEVQPRAAHFILVRIQVRSGISQGSELILLTHFLIRTCLPDVTSPGDLVVQVPLPGPVIDFQLLGNRQRG
jgi:hypothetical protein